MKKRLITRSDFDGLVCAVLLKEMDLIEDIKFVHPKDMQDGIIEVSENDISTNLPYVEGIGLAFDHHLSETIRNEKKDNHIIDPDAPSAARVVYDYYGGKDKFPMISDEMMAAVDKADAAWFTEEDILDPKGWELLSFLMDARTGLGRFRDFRISNYNLMMDLIDYCKNHTIEEILQLEDVKERVDLFFSYKDQFYDQIRKNARVQGDVLVVNLKDEETIYPGNRFVKYALYPDTKISVQVIWGFRKQNTVFTVGKSIINRSSDVNIGEIMLSYGGGGHKNAGTCQVDHEDADRVLEELLVKLQG
ncbi:exopolyphosphatase [Acidaminobacter sp. JC074]|uniref:exopolyphosphatase n=1 Tax=Acidaminobacter sp. JC074 TaxID=2530199 RepID=UPI001F0DB45F|nr:exopolyphosphatase [Acidaminobacter sp. JC074]MCH4888010.1 exopolyphosphatase [Acidaminobacter sp. JC074]